MTDADHSSSSATLQEAAETVIGTDPTVSGSVVPAIEVRDLRKVFGRPPTDLVALQDITFHCQAGQVVGLIGPNGAGKSTTMRVLSTILRPTAGSAKVAGFDVVTQAEDVRRKIGFLSNNTGLYDRMTAWEHVDYFGQLYQVPQEDRHARIDELFDQLRMNDFRNVFASKMSTGMKQKVSIARALVHNPAILIFDEPTTGLDVLAARVVMETIHRLRDQQKCILYSTHIMSEVDHLCDELVIIHQGRLLAADPLADLREKHDNAPAETILYQLIDRADQEAHVPASGESKAT